jgi:2-iminobutanoate/2-iminopropanoate deaminase
MIHLSVHSNSLTSPEPNMIILNHHEDDSIGDLVYQNIASKTQKEPMELRKIETDQAPKAIGPYSQAVAFENFVFVSGQIPIDPKTGSIADPTIQGQTRQVLANIEAILKADGLSFENVIKAEIYVTDINDFHTINSIYAEKFSHPIKPARQLMQVAKLPMDSKIEISCIAVRTR